MSSMIFFVLVKIVLVKRKTTKQARGIQWTFTQKLEDLDFADDVNLLSHSHRDMEAKTNDLQACAQLVGF